jgi:hypothetical protein
MCNDPQWHTDRNFGTMGQKVTRRSLAVDRDDNVSTRYYAVATDLQEVDADDDDDGDERYANSIGHAVVGCCCFDCSDCWSDCESNEPQDSLFGTGQTEAFWMEKVGSKIC